MKITRYTTFLVQPEHAKTCLFVKLDTDSGIHGWGEVYTIPGREPAQERLTHELAEYLIGRDPHLIRHFTHTMWRDLSIKRGGLDFYCVLSGLEIALWDIVGKDAGQPVYNLLGGPCRSKIRVYGQPSGGGPGLDGLAKGSKNTAARGFTGVKFDPFPGPWQEIVDTKVEREAAERVRVVREAVGPDVEVLIEVHRRLAPMHAIAVARAIEPYRPFWFEEPTPAENLDATAEVRRKINIPVVAGEALYTKWDFRNVFAKEAADIVNPDVCNTGGILELREIAGMAEAACVAVAPHGHNSTTVGLAASIQVVASIPNFLIMEYPVAWESVANEVAKNPFRVVDGAIALPTEPGIGIDLDEAALARFPYKGTARRQLTDYTAEWP
jgi:galactonate dehydratase